MVLAEGIFWEAVCRHVKKSVMSDETKNSKFRQASMETLQMVCRRVKGYVNDSYDFRLVITILYKKGRMIEEAKTKTELSEIAKPSVPTETYCGFKEGPFHVPEEEMILWSYASLVAPLNRRGYERYMELFMRFFPEAAEKLEI